MKFQNEQFELEVIDESLWRKSSLDNARQYSKDYLLGENFQNAPRYGIIVKSLNGPINSCLVLANGATTTVHTNLVAITDSTFFLAIGNSICCFEMPSLALKWHQKVDTVTCFGVYISPERKCIISHGEIDIAKVSFDGEAVCVAESLFRQSGVASSWQNAGMMPNPAHQYPACSCGVLVGG